MSVLDRLPWRRRRAAWRALAVVDIDAVTAELPVIPAPRPAVDDLIDADPLDVAELRRDDAEIEALRAHRGAVPLSDTGDPVRAALLGFLARWQREVDDDGEG